jgi:hypothetical protein
VKTTASSHTHDVAVEAAIAALRAELLDELGKLAGRHDAALDTLAARIAALEEAPEDPGTPPTDPPPPTDWPTRLQQAIDNAPAGGTLDLRGVPEPYSELVLITKPITLVGAWIDGSAFASNASAIGIEVRGTQDVTLVAPRVEDVRYCGIMVADSLRVEIDDPVVRRVDAQRQNANMNAYGIAVTDRGTRRSADVTVRRALVEDVPDWHGLDTHGGIRVKFLDSIVRRTNRAIFVTASTLGGATECEVSRNLCAEPTPRRDVLTKPPYNEVGLTVVGGCTAFGDANVFEGWPAGNAVNVQSGGIGTFTGTVVR